MVHFLSLVYHEFKLSTRRKGLWIAFLIIFLFFGISIITPSDSGPKGILENTAWQTAGELVYMFNMLMPLVGGILAADRMKRDFTLGVRELETSTPLSNTVYILSKYFGVLLSTLFPMFLFVLVSSVYIVASGQSTLALFPSVCAAFAAISVPSFSFVVAFSIACPLVMPLRVYQILFTGYWFWGNYINPKAFPSISDTLLNASGIYAEQGLFQGLVSRTSAEFYTPAQAWLNILVLLCCAAVPLFALGRYLAWQDKSA
ncbi:MAG: ABC transporter permease [Anaerolineales bacterium]|nr:ABC transporter permease [Anaerolineales bacterium]